MTKTSEEEALREWRQIRDLKEEISRMLAYAAIEAFKERGVHVQFGREDEFIEKLQEVIERYTR